MGTTRAAPNAAIADLLGNCTARARPMCAIKVIKFLALAGESKSPK